MTAKVLVNLITGKFYNTTLADLQMSAVNINQRMHNENLRSH